MAHDEWVKDMIADVATLKTDMGMVKKDLYNGEDPKQGFIAQASEIFTELRLDARRRRDAWKKRLGVAGILAALATGAMPYLWPAGKSVVQDIMDIHQIVKEWHQMHKSEFNNKKITKSSDELYTVRMNQPQEADFTKLQAVR